MIFSSSHRFIYCHVPKTGGTSIRNQLRQYRRQQESSIPFKVCRRLGLANTYPFYDFYNKPHTTLSKAKFLLGDRIYSELYVFAVMRDPVDWLISCYKFFMLGNSVVKGNNSASIASFPDYIDAMIALDDLKPCQSLLLVNEAGSLLVDEIGRFDSLLSFCSRISSIAGLDSIKLPHLNTNAYISDDSKLDVQSNLPLINKIRREWALDFELWDLIQVKSSGLRYSSLSSPSFTHTSLINYDPWGMFDWQS